MPGHCKLVYALLLRALSDHCHQVVLLQFYFNDTIAQKNKDIAADKGRGVQCARKLTVLGN